MVMADFPDTRLLPPDCQIILITTQPHSPAPSLEVEKHTSREGGRVRTFARFWDQYNIEMSRKFHKFVANLSQFWGQYNNELRN
jgi:hypothetical protein